MYLKSHQRSTSTKALTSVFYGREKSCDLQHLSQESKILDLQKTISTQKYQIETLTQELTYYMDQC